MVPRRFHIRLVGVPLVFLLAATLVTGEIRAQDEEENSGADRTREGELDETEIQPERVEERMVVSASRVEESLLDAPASVSVVTGEEVLAAPDPAMPEVLRRTPGMNVIQFGSRDYNLTSRGATSSLATSQQVLVDGRTIYLDFFGFILWETLPFQPEELEQVEVVRGPGSAIWGANALNGVVNFRTRSPRDLAGTHSVRADAGEKDSGSLGFLTAQAGDKVAWKFSAGYRQQNEPWPRPLTAPSGFELPPYENSGFQNPKFEFRVDRDNDGGGQASLTLGGAQTAGMIMTGIGPFDIDDGTRLWHGIGRWSREETEIQFFVNVVDGDATNVLNALPFVFKTASYDFSGRTSRTVGRHRFSYGGNLRYNDFDLSIAPNGSRRREAGVFLTDEWLYADKWSLHTGLRLDWFDTIGAVASPRVALVHRIHDDHSIRMSWNRAYRSPSLINNFLDTTIFLDFPIGGCQADSVFPVQAQGNPELDETRLEAWEIGYTGRIGSRWRLNAAAYYNVTDDLVDFHPTDHYSRDNLPPNYCGPQFLFDNPDVRKRFPERLSYRNVAEIKEYGTEIGVDFQEGPWRAWVTWSWQNAPDVEGEPLDPLDEFAINVAARNRAGVGLSYDGRVWGASMTYDFVGRAFWSDVLSDPFWGYSEEIGLLGIKAYLRHPSRDLTWEVAAVNAADDNDPQHPFADELGRIVRTGFTWKF